MLSIMEIAETLSALEDGVQKLTKCNCRNAPGPAIGEAHSSARRRWGRPVIKAALEKVAAVLADPEALFDRSVINDATAAGMEMHFSSLGPNTIADDITDVCDAFDSETEYAGSYPFSTDEEEQIYSIRNLVITRTPSRTTVELVTDYFARVAADYAVSTIERVDDDLEDLEDSVEDLPGADALESVVMHREALERVRITAEELFDLASTARANALAAA